MSRILDINATNLLPFRCYSPECRVTLNVNKDQFLDSNKPKCQYCSEGNKFLRLCSIIHLIVEDSKGEIPGSEEFEFAGNRFGNPGTRFKILCKYGVDHYKRSQQTIRHPGQPTPRFQKFHVTRVIQAATCPLCLQELGRLDRSLFEQFLQDPEKLHTTSPTPEGKDTLKDLAAGAT